ncbi:MAG: hypothetical protein DRQ44_10015, partial [Gammaproteobacteria bacterium]
MRKQKQTIFCKAVFILLLALFATESLAVINSISVNSNKKNLIIGSPNTITVTWKVSVTDSNTPIKGAIYALSNTGSYTAGTTTVGSQNTQIGDSIEKTTNPQSQTFTLTETISVPATVLFQAQQLGISSIQYRRDFTDSDKGAGTGILNLALAGSSSAGGGTSPVIGTTSAATLDVNRNSMRFSDQSLIKVTQTGETVNAEAEINYTGTGLFEGVWEVARPETTRGTSVFSTIKRVSQFLSSRNVITFKIKNLPTDALGFYIVRFRILSPAVSISQPAIRYVVQTESLKNKTVKPGSLNPLTPAEFSLLNKATEFTWDAVTGAKAYQLEFYANKIPVVMSLQLKQGMNTKDGPVTGVLVPATKTK